MKNANDFFLKHSRSKTEITDKIFDSRLSRYEKSVWMLLKTFTSNGYQPSLVEICKYARTGQRTLKRSLLLLEEKNMITVIRSYSGGGKNEYHCLRPSDWKIEKDLRNGENE